MGKLGRFSVATLCSLVVLMVCSWLGMLFLMLFDSNYHNGYSLLGGFIIGLIAAVWAFTAVWKKLAT
jgi:hypothetical protein